MPEGTRDYYEACLKAVVAELRTIGGGISADDILDAIWQATGTRISAGDLAIVVAGAADLPLTLIDPNALYRLKGRKTA